MQPCLGMTHAASSLPSACSAADGSNGWERVYPRSSAAVKAWSDTSDFISTRDSFSSREEGEQPHAHGGYVHGGAGHGL